MTHIELEVINCLLDVLYRVQAACPKLNPNTKSIPFLNTCVFCHIPVLENYDYCDIHNPKGEDIQKYREAKKLLIINYLKKQIEDERSYDELYATVDIYQYYAWVGSMVNKPLFPLSCYENLQDINWKVRRKEACDLITSQYFPFINKLNLFENTEFPTWLKWAEAVLEQINIKQPKFDLLKFECFFENSKLSNQTITDSFTHTQELEESLADEHRHLIKNHNKIKKITNKLNDYHIELSTERLSKIYLNDARILIFTIYRYFCYLRYSQTQIEPKKVGRPKATIPSSSEKEIVDIFNELSTLFHKPSGRAIAKLIGKHHTYVNDTIRKYNLR